jgi:HSP20 family molecular chaperone IbpA
VSQPAQPQVTAAQPPKQKILYDIWESPPKKIVVAFDVAGVEPENVEIQITGVSIIVSKRMGSFEDKHLYKYKQIVGNRYRIISLLGDQIVIGDSILLL